MAMTQLLVLPQDYCSGQRQRVGLARAIYNKPKLIVLDDPNSNLDDIGERDLLTTLREMKESGSTIIIITHKTSILTLADKVLVMDDGLASRFGERDAVIKSLNAEHSNVTQLQKKP